MSAEDFKFYWCLMNVNSAGFPVESVKCYTINDSYGKYAHIKNGAPINGGTPIGQNVQEHYDTLVAHLTYGTGHGGFATTIYEPGSLFQLDYEAYGPVMPENGTGNSTLQAYYDLAMEQMQALRPDLSGQELEDAAKAEWTLKVQQFFEASIDAAKATRPELQWGIYYPQARHYWNDAYSGALGDARRASNDLLSATWAKLDFFPLSVYYFYPTGTGSGTGTEAANRRYIRDNVKEYVRLRGDDDRKIIPMIEPYIHHSNGVYGRQPIPNYDLDLIWEESYYAGADGIMVWGWISTNVSTHSTEEQEKIQLALTLKNAHERFLKKAQNMSWADYIKTTYLQDNPYQFFIFDDASVAEDQLVVDHSGNGNSWYLSGSTIDPPGPLPETLASTLLPVAGNQPTGWHVNKNAPHNTADVHRLAPNTAGTGSNTTPASPWRKLSVETLAVPDAYVNGQTPFIEYGQMLASGRQGFSVGGYFDRWALALGGHIDGDADTIVNHTSGIPNGTPGAQYVPGNLEHRVVTWDGDTGAIEHYLNGTLIWSDTTTINFIDFFQGQYWFLRGIGGYAGWRGVVFLGAVYNSVLSLEKIQDRWTLLTTLRETDTVDDGAVDIIVDNGSVFPGRGRRKKKITLSNGTALEA